MRILWSVTSFKKQFFEEQQLSDDESLEGDGGKGYTAEISIDLLCISRLFYVLFCFSVSLMIRVITTSCRTLRCARTKIEFIARFGIHPNTPPNPPI